MATNETSIKGSAVGVIINGSPKKLCFGNVSVGDSSSSQEDDFDLPEPIKIYAGREEELKRMESLFFNEDQTCIKNKVVICGIAGIGKSELAVQFADKWRKVGKINKVYRIIAEHEAEIKKSWPSVKQIYETSEKGKTLFILDNGINRHKISTCGFKMPDEFLFIITSQLKDWGDDIVQIELSALDPKSAVEFYKKKLDLCTDKNCNLFEELANLVGCLPLGLQITAAGVREYRKMYGENCVHEYLNEFNSEDKIIKEEFPSSSDNPYDKSINKAIKMTIDKIEAEAGPGKSSLTLDVLYMCSRLECFSNPYPQLRFILANNKKYVSYDRNMLNNALRVLDNLSLLTFQNDRVVMHRYTKKIVHIILKTDREEKFYELCLETVSVSADKYTPLVIIEAILQDIDDTIKGVIMQFLKKHNSKILVPEVCSVFTVIFKTFIYYKHKEFIKEIFDTFDYCILDYIIECNLLEYAKNELTMQELFKNYLDNSCSKDMNNSAWKTTKAIEYYKFKVKDLYKDKDRELWKELATLVGCVQPGLKITAGGVLEYKQIHGENCVQKYVEDLKYSQHNIDDEEFKLKFDKPYDKICYGAIKISLKKIEANAGPLGTNFTFDILCIISYLGTLEYYLLERIFNKVMKGENYNINVEQKLDAWENIGVTPLQYDAIKMHGLNRKKINYKIYLDPELVTLKNIALISLDHFNITMDSLTQKIIRYHFRTNYRDNERKLYEMFIEFALKYSTPNFINGFEYTAIRSLLKHIDANIELYIMNIIAKNKRVSQLEGLPIILNCLVVWGHKEITKNILDFSGHCAEDYITEYKLVQIAEECDQPDMKKFLQDYLKNECQNTSTALRKLI